MPIWCKILLLSVFAIFFFLMCIGLVSSLLPIGEGLSLSLPIFAQERAVAEAPGLLKLKRMKQPYQIASISDYAPQKCYDSTTSILQKPLVDSFYAEGARELL